MSGRIGLRAKLMLMFFAVFVIPLLAVFIAMNLLYTNAAVESVSDSALENTRQIAYDIDRELAAAAKAFGRLAEIANVPGASADGAEAMALPARAGEELDGLLDAYEEIGSLVIYYRNGEHYVHGDACGVVFAQLRDSLWYTACLRNPGQVVCSQIIGDAADAPEHTAHALLSMAPDTPGRDVELVSLVLKEELFASIFERLSHLDGVETALVTSGGEVISKNSELSGALTDGVLDRISGGGEGCFQLDGGTRCLVSYLSLEHAGWRLVNLWPLDTLTHRTGNILLVLSIGGFAAVLLIFSVLTYMMFRTLLVPIGDLASGIRKVEAGNFDLSLRTDWSYREFNDLSQAIMDMAARIKALINAIDAKEVMKRKLEIRALQYQFNPHFLKNTLSAIRLLAMLGKTDDVKAVTSALSNIVSSSIEDDTIYTSVQREIVLLQDYVRIMLIRYQEQFAVEYDVDPELDGCRILKNVLQPLVENSIFHGISGRRSGGLVRITGTERGGNIVFTVEDNGKGMSEAVLRELREGTRRGKSLGVYNLESRIKLNYGQRYGLQFESAVGCFTRVTLRIPLQREARAQSPRDAEGDGTRM